MDKPEVEFDYVIKHPPPPRLCFGSTRVRMPEPTGKRIEFDRLSTDVWQHDRLQLRCPAVLSKLGYGPLASLTPRFFESKAKVRQQQRNISFDSKHPDSAAQPIRPSSVQTPPPPRQCWPPFGRSMRERHVVSTTPGPCRYMPYHERLERFNHSFGGRRSVRPAVRTICTPTDQVACSLCRRWQPHALFWVKRERQQRDRVLCRSCMAATRRQLLHNERSHVRRQRLANELNRFERSRHINTMARVPVQSRRELLHLYRIENYLAAFGI